MSRRQRKIYDNDGTVVMATENASASETAPIRDEVSVYKANAIRSSGKEVQVTDVFETMAAYMMPNFRFINSSEKGACMICGKETSMSARKLCGDCMKESGERIYNLAYGAIQSGEKEVKI